MSGKKWEVFEKMLDNWKTHIITKGLVYGKEEKDLFSMQIFNRIITT